MFDLKDYPYSSIFDANPIIFAKSWGNQIPETAQASLDNLRSLLPDGILNTEKNIDLLGVAFNAAIVNQVNQNDDVMDTETALAVADTFAGKFLNLEHKREKIIGHIVTAGFSSMGESNRLYSCDIQDTKDPFNISLGAAVYKIVDKELANRIESSADPSSPHYNTLSASWEVGFADYRLILGSKNLKEAEIIENPIQIASMKKNLRAYGGSGTYGNAPIYRLIGRDCLALGVGLTKKPAAKVKGLITKSAPEQLSTKASFFGGFFNNFDKDKKTSVTTIKTKDMEKFELILEEIKASLLENKVKETTIAGITKDISEQIRVASEDYVKKIAEKEAEKISAETALAKIKATQEAQAIELADTKEKLSTLEAKASAEAAANLFSVRMSEMDAEFDLDDEDRQVLASDIKALDETEAAFVLFKKKAGVLMKDKNKEAKKKKDEEAKASIDKAVELKLAELAKASTKTLSEKELAEKALEEAKASKSSVTLPNNNQSQSEQQGFKEKFAAAFAKENVTISK